MVGLWRELEDLVEGGEEVAVAQGGGFRYSGVWFPPDYFGDKSDRWFLDDYTGAGAKADGKVDLAYLTESGEFYMVMTRSGESAVYNARQRSDDNGRSFRRPRPTPGARSSAPWPLTTCI